MELRTLITFLRIAELQSFSKAAAELNYSQAAVTIQIHELEKELNTRLFDRIGKRIALTQQGECFLQHARRIIEEVNHAKQAVSEDSALNGSLRIGTVESLCATRFPELLTTFHQLYPQVSLCIKTAAPDQLLTMMDHNELDLVYLLDSKRNHKNWIKVFEAPEEIVFAASSQHRLAASKQLKLNDLLDENFILTENNVSYRHALDQQLYAQQKTIDPYLEIGNTDFIIGLIAADMGISLLPKFTIEDAVAKQSISILPVSDFQLISWRQIFYHKNKWLTREMEAFLKIALEL